MVLILYPVAKQRNASPVAWADYNGFVANNPQPRLGQVFLTDRRFQQRIIRLLGLEPGEAVLEIGAGQGNMTERLASQGARVWAVELDSHLASALRRKFADHPAVQVLEADILQVPLDTIACLAGQSRIKVFGNLPYYITSDCLLHLFEHHRCIAEIVVMVQREVAARIVAAPGSPDYGLLSLTCQYYTQPAVLFSLPPSAFRPPPRVYSALVRMRVDPKREALGIRDEGNFWCWVKAAFAQRRKTLCNNWKGLCDPEPLRCALKEFGLDLRVRAEELSLDQLANLYKILGK